MRELIGKLRIRRKQTDRPAVVEAIRAGAAYLAQGASYSYIRARTLLAGPRLFSDDGFGLAMQICKWEAFAVAAQDLILIIEADLRPSLPDDQSSRARSLAALYADVLAAEEMPEHRKGTGWNDLRAEFDKRLIVYLDKAPLKPDAISIATAMRLLDHAPVDPDVRIADQMMVVNNVAFRFIDHQSRLRRELDFDALARLLADEMREAA